MAVEAGGVNSIGDITDFIAIHFKRVLFPRATALQSYHIFSVFKHNVAPCHEHGR